MYKTFFSGLIGLLILFVGVYPGQAHSGIALPARSGVRLIESSDTGVLLEFSAPLDNLRIVKSQDESTLFEYPGAETSQVPGQPQLPVFSALLGIPAGAELKLTILSSERSLLDRPAGLKISPFPAPLQEDFQPGEWSDQPLQSSVAEPASGSLDSTEPASLSEPVWVRDQRLVRIEFSPAQILADANQLLWHNRLLVRIDFLGSKSGSDRSPSQTRVNANPFEKTLEQMLINYATAREWRGYPIDSVNAQRDGSQEQAADAGQSNPNRYRIEITKDGLYRLTYENLTAAGVPLDSLALSNLKLSTQGQEAAYYFQDAMQDGVFNQGDGLIFFGQKFYGDRMAQRYAAENSNWYTYSRQLPDGTSEPWKPEMNATMLEKYTDTNVYWLTTDGSIPGMAFAESGQVQTDTSQYSSRTSLGTAEKLYLPLAGKAGIAQTYRHHLHAEESHRWKTTLFAGEETWFWEEIKTSTDTHRTYSLYLDSIAPEGTAILRGEIVAATENTSASPDHHIKIYLNDPTQSQAVLEAFWDGKSRYRFEVQVPQAQLVDGENLLVLKVILTPALYVEDLFIDWFEMDYERRFVAEADQVIFRAGADGHWQYKIDGFTGPGVQVFNISDALQPERVNYVLESGGSIRFRVMHSAGDQFIAGMAEDIPPNAIDEYTPPDFSQPVEYVIITPPEFAVTAQALADFRASQGLTSRVINLLDLYAEFNDGILNPIAIKNFLKFTLTSWGAPPQYVVLVGDGHWNLKGYSGYDAPPVYMPPNLAWVDPWQGEVDSANLLTTVVGDDPLADVMIGRIPVNSSAQLQTVIDKIIAYESAPPADWQYHLLFVADDTPDDAGDFVAQSNQIIAEYISENYVADQVYLDDYKDTGTCDLQPGDPSYKCPAATAAIVNDLNQIGALIVNYEGHGAINYWTGEQIFMNQDIASLANSARLPIVLSMTCLDGYWIHPNLSSEDKSGPSLIEEMLRASQKGAIAAFSPTGLGVSTGHNALQRGFYDAIFKNGVLGLGEAAQSAKLNLYNTGYSYDLLHTFTIFGDPALRIPMH